MAVVKANIVREQDGIPLIYSDCKRGFGIRVVHPQNPKAQSKNVSMQILYIAPGGELATHNHENEEIYFILEGKGEGDFGYGNPINVEKGMFFHLPAFALHGLKNTGDSMLKVLISTSPPLPPFPEWEIKKGEGVHGQKVT